MSPRWLMCLAVGLATQGAFAQTAPTVAPDPGMEYSVDAEQVDDTGPVAPEPPPNLPPETPSARPFTGAVWTSGHWYWDGDQWQYKPGAWVQRMDGYQYVNGYWDQDGTVWRWVSGGWAQPGSNQVEIPIAVADEEVQVAQAPPALRTEVRTAPPAPDYTWTPGYWYWTGVTWNWITGAWMAPPRPGMVYVSPRWVHRGPSWYFVGGGWSLRGGLHVSIPIYRHAGISVSLGRPNYFLRSWHRYPVVTWRHRPPAHVYRHEVYRSYRDNSRSRPGPSPRYHDASPSRGRGGGGYGGNSHGGGGYRGGNNHGGGNSHGGSHGASPAGGHGGRHH